MNQSLALRTRIKEAVKDWEENGYIEPETMTARQRLFRPIDVLLSSQFAELTIRKLEDNPPENLVRDLDLARRWLCCQVTRRDVWARLDQSIPRSPPLRAATTAVLATLRGVVEEEPEQPYLFCIDYAVKQAHISHLLATRKAAAYAVASKIAYEQPEKVWEQFSLFVNDFLRSQLNDETAFSLLEAYEAGSEEARGVWIDRVTDTGLAAELTDRVATIFI